MNEPSNEGGSGSDDLNAVNQTPENDSIPTGDDKLLSVFVGPGILTTSHMHSEGSQQAAP